MSRIIEHQIDRGFGGYFDKCECGEVRVYEQFGVRWVSKCKICQKENIVINEIK